MVLVYTQKNTFDYWDKIENLDINLLPYGDLIFFFYKEARNIHWKKKTVSSTNGAVKLDICM